MVDPEFADVLAQLSTADFQHSMKMATQLRNFEVLEVYKHEEQARIFDIAAARIVSETIWPSVWNATLMGLDDDAICQAIKEGKKPHDVASELEFERRADETVGRAEHWPPFPDADIPELKDAGIRSRDARMWWNAGARNARTIATLRNAGIHVDEAEMYAAAGLDTDEMVVFHRAGLRKASQVEDHIAGQLAEHSGPDQVRRRAEPLY